MLKRVRSSLSRNKGIHILKLVAGSALAIWIASALSLTFSASAGIITLLTIQSTKKETIRVAFRRLVAFLVAVGISVLSYSLLGFGLPAFSLFLLLFVGFCVANDMYESIPINSVLATHYWLAESVSPGMVGEEALLMLIGSGIGILFNLYMPENVSRIRKKQAEIEAVIQEILRSFQAELAVDKGCVVAPKRELDPSHPSALLLDRLRGEIEEGLKEVQAQRDNALFQEESYFAGYMQMRRQQYILLREMAGKVLAVTCMLPQSQGVAAFMGEIADSLAEANNAKVLLQKGEDIRKSYQESALPQTRREFETRAVLFTLLMDLELFLRIKESFTDQLTQGQKERYWRT